VATGLARLGAIFSPRAAAKQQWQSDALEWEQRGAPTRLLKQAAYIPSTRAVYVPVAKSANSSIRAMLAECGSVPIVKSGITLSDLASGEVPAFTVVRHPVARFWSAYADKIVRKIDATDAKLVDDVRRDLGIAKAAAISAGQMLDYLERKPLDRIDQHFAPQWHCTGIGHVPFSFVGRVESLADDLAELIRRGLIPQSSRLPHLNQSRRKSASEDDSLRPRIEAFYRRDFVEFGYQL
jgi:hypothetical protein